LLESQRIQALSDLENLIERQKEVLKDPIEFVNKLQHKVDLKLPSPQNVVSLPTIHWENYVTNVESLKFNQMRHMTRGKQQIPATLAAVTKKYSSGKVQVGIVVFFEIPL